MQKTSAVAAYLAIVLVAAPADVRAQSVPRAARDSAAETRVRALIAGMNTGRPSALERFFDTSFVQRLITPANLDGFLRDQMRAYDRERGWELVDVRVSAPGEAIASVRGKLTAQMAKASVIVDTAAPYRIMRMPLIIAWVPPTDEPFPAAATDAERVRELDRFMQKLADADAFAGVVLLAKDGLVLFSKAYGDADKEFGVPNRVDTKLEIASMTKMFTAVAIAQLAEQGKLSLEDTLGRWLPDFPNREARSKVRIKHLLSHTSGMQDYGDVEWRGGHRLRSVADRMEEVHAGQKDTLDRPPGRRHVYLNAGFQVLGRIVELASGRDYFEYMEENVLRRAGLENTGWYRADFLLRNQARYYWRDYTDDSRRWRVGLPSLNLRPSPEAGVKSTVHDLLRFEQALRTGKLVGKQYVDLFLSAKPELGAPSWGYGFEVVQDPRAGRVVGHGGTGGPVSACLDVYLDTGYTAVILSSYSGGRYGPRAKIRALVPPAADARSAP